MSIVERLFDKTYPALLKTMDLHWRRNQAVISNIANAETPQYRAVDLNFAGELERAFGKSNQTLSKTDAKHMDLNEASAARLMPDYSGVTKPDGNNVDIDIEMGKLSYNAGRYSSAANILRKKLGMLKLAIRESVR